MTSRPVFGASSAEPWFTETNIHFEWTRGQHYTRRQLCADALYLEAENVLGVSDILEVSTYSRSLLGQSLSAMNLTFFEGSYAQRTVEHAYQASKVFAMGGPFLDILQYDNPRNAKRDPRLTTSGRMMGFDLGRLRLDVSCGSSAYDAIYIAALGQNQHLIDDLSRYRYFTDIAFNPQTMLATQARSLAIAVSLAELNIDLPTDPREVYDCLINHDFIAPTVARQYALF